MTPHCPHCQANLQGEPIPAEYRVHKDDCDRQVQLYGRCFCLPYGDATHFSRTIGHAVQGVYDGILYWQCPDCGKAWPRAGHEGVRKERALYYVRLHNEAVERAVAGAVRLAT